VLAKEKVAVVQCCGVYLNYKVVWAGLGGWDFTELKSGKVMLVVCY
jgi:hypothetical protein